MEEVLHLLRGVDPHGRRELDLRPVGALRAHRHVAAALEARLDARRQADGVPLMIVAGREYGSGSSRDWAAKGPRLLGVQVVLAESFERIHRSNLVQLGILPLEFEPGQSRETLSLTGRETFTVTGIAGDLKPRQRVTVTATAPNTVVKTFHAIARLDTAIDVTYYRHGGILPYVLRGLVG